MSYRDRSVAIVVRDGKILMERLCYPDAKHVQNFYETIVGWGDEISYPGEK